VIRARLVPERQYQYVYALWDCVPEEYLAEFVLRLIDRYVEKAFDSVERGPA